MFGGVDFFGCCGLEDLRIPESSFFKKSLHPTFEQLGGKKYVTLINCNSGVSRQ
jgi:hypothetical protein